MDNLEILSDKAYETNKRIEELKAQMDAIAKEIAKEEVFLEVLEKMLG